jgi:hypothetical protein
MASGLQRSGMFGETRFLARVYADIMRDDFRGFQIMPEDKSQSTFQSLQDEFETGLQSDRGLSLSELFRIEMAMVGIAVEDFLKERLWVIEDRFRRVVPSSMVARYEASTSAIDAGRRHADNAGEATSVRNRYRTLLDLIHTNYLLNIAREQSLRRLRLFLLAGSIIIILSVIGTGIFFDPQFFPFFAIFATGIAGALCSALQRVQKAVGYNAMAADPVYDMVSLRIGYGGILVSIFTGGVFALLLYIIVVAGYASQLLPAGAADSAKSAAELAMRGATGNPPMSADPTASALAISTGQQNSADGTGPKAGDAASVDSQQPGQRSAAAPRDEEPSIYSFFKTLVTPAYDWDPANLFRMLLLAFLAGFTERLVPDILTRLSQRRAESD